MDEFLDMLGQRIDLSEHRGYKGGLDTVHGQTGQHSVYQVLYEEDILFLYIVQILHAILVLEKVPSEGS